MGDELKKYFQQKYNKIAEDDEVKKKVSLIRKKMFQNESNFIFNLVTQEEC